MDSGAEGSSQMARSVAGRLRGWDGVGAASSVLPGWRTLRWVPALVVFLLWIVVPATPAPTERVNGLAAPFGFHLLDWETQHLVAQLGRVVGGLVTVPSAKPTDGALVQSYFQTPMDQRAPLRDGAEGAMERAISSVYQSGGVTRDTPLGPRVFPPILFSLSAPPYVLVVSPRTTIRVQQSVLLTTDLTTSAQQSLEQSTDSLGVSSLVTPIGGIGASYPSMVPDQPTAHAALQTAAHEWIHQYFFFFPLGQAYWSNQEARAINETAADMVSVEVGNHAFSLLGLTDPTPQTTQPAPPVSAPAFSFNAFMRQTRARTDQLLANGQVDDAEAYMDRRRDELQTHGYYIRKINQAFFAFYGSYTEGFGAAPADPTADLLTKLRGQRPSLGDFMVTLRTITSVDQLRATVQNSGE